MSKIDMMKYLSDKEVDSIYRRLYSVNFDLDRELKINLIYDAYKDKSLLGLLLTGEEIEFLNSNLYKSNISENFHSIDLANLGILIKDEYGFYMVPDELIPLLKQGIEFYFSNIGIEEYKERFYLVIGILRIKGALILKDIKRYLSSFTTDESETLNEFLISPIYHRFFKKIKFRSRIYIVYQEFEDKSDLEFIKFQREDDEIYYSYDEVIEIGKHYFIYESDPFNGIIESPMISYLLNKSNRTDMIIYSAENNFNYNDYLDKNIIENMPIEEFDMFDDFMRLIPSFVPTDLNALFWDPCTYKSIVQYTRELYEFSSKYYGIPIDPREKDPLEKLISRMSYDDFSIAKDYLKQIEKDCLDDEKEFLRGVSKTRIKDYIVLSENNNGLIVRDMDGNFYSVKMPQDSGTSDRGIKAHFAKMSLVAFHERILIFTYIPGKSLSKEEVEECKKALEKAKNNIILKLE